MDEQSGSDTQPIKPSGDGPGTPEASSLYYDSPTIPIQPIQPPGRPAVAPEWPVARPGRRAYPPSAQEPGCFGITIVSIVGAALVLALIAGVLFALHSLNSPSQSEGSSATVPPVQTVVLPTATASPQPSPTPAPTATATATDTPTPAPEPAQLSVSPKRVTGNCLLGQYPDLTVKNDGGSDLTWTATPSDSGVQASPASGTLAAGETQTVSLSGLHVGKSFTVTFSGNGGDATVTITCH